MLQINGKQTGLYIVPEGEEYIKKLKKDDFDRKLNRLDITTNILAFMKKNWILFFYKPKSQEFVVPCSCIYVKNYPFLLLVLTIKMRQIQPPGFIFTRKKTHESSGVLGSFWG